MEKATVSGSEHKLERYLSPINVWALSFGCAVGWGAFVMPGTTFLPQAGPIGTSFGLILGAVVMFIIGVNYHYLMNKFQDAGGTLTYTVKTFGYDHGFMSAWFLILVHVAIIWANASALALISKNLFGKTFQFGFYYQILGYEVYFGEVLLSVGAILICGFLCMKSKSMAAWMQTILAFALILGILIVAVGVGVKSPDAHFVPEPGFATGKGTPLRQFFSIIALSPWAYVGFESIANSAAGFKFSAKKALPIMSLALLASVVAYVALAQIAVAILPEGFTGWEDYISRLGSQEGLLGLPTFNVAGMAMGNLGIHLLGVAALSGMLTGLIGNYVAASRLLLVMAKDGMLPKWFGKLDRDNTPRNALIFLMGISILIPLLGRTAIGWIVDVNTIGAVIAYAYTSADAFVNARKEKKIIVEITGIIGFAMSLFFFLYFMLLFSNGMSTESYLILASWSILGFMYFRIVFENDRKRRFGKSTIVWIVLLFLIFLTSLLWVKRATDEMTVEVVNNIKQYYEAQNLDKSAETVRLTESYIQEQLQSVDRRLTRNSVVQMSLNTLSLIIMFSIYSIMSKREKAAEVETIKANERSRAKTVFLSNMSHDIRTPMNAIIGYVNLAEEENVTKEELLDYVQKIKGSSNHLLALINDILEMSRIESGKVELEPVPMELGEVFGGLKNLFATQMSEKRIDYVVDSTDIEDRYVYCDKNRLNRILLNLVSNAYKFTPEGGTVKVVAREKQKSMEGKNTYEIRVSDSGIGMSREFADKVFEAFEREKTATVSGIQGSGLGMSIVKSLVEMMDGDIKVKTAQGKGTEFVVTIKLQPLEQEEVEKLRKQKDQEKEKQQAGMNFTGRRILLVDDVMVNRQIAKKLLERSGFTVEEADNGEKAVGMIEAVSAGYYDVVLMDIQMPVMDGYEATAAIRALGDEKKSQVPVIAMTANAFSEDIRKASEAGMNGHIAKPIDVQNMLKVLADTIG
jgi:signal transduction histidine kinase/ActR/RegA family two-component response regulator